MTYSSIALTLRNSVSVKKQQQTQTNGDNHNHQQQKQLGQTKHLQMSIAMTTMKNKSSSK